MLTAAERNEMLVLMSDLSKEAYGFRVRKDYTNCSDEEIQADWDHYIREAEFRRKEEERQEAEALLEWRGHIAKMMNDHTIDSHTAIRWDMEAMDCDDFEHYLWRCGISLRLTGELGKLHGFKVYGYC